MMTASDKLKVFVWLRLKLLQINAKTAAAVPNQRTSVLLMNQPRPEPLINEPPPLLRSKISGKVKCVAMICHNTDGVITAIYEPV